MTEPLAPGAVIGILGGGQLGRMLSVAASRLGYRCHIYEPGAAPAAGPLHIRALSDDSFEGRGIATPADAAMMMQLGAEGVFVGSGIFKSGNPAQRAAAIVQATTFHDDPDVLAKVSRGLGEAMVGINVDDIPQPHRLAGLGPHLPAGEFDRQEGGADRKAARARTPHDGKDGIARCLHLDSEITDIEAGDGGRPIAQHVA